MLGWLSLSLLPMATSSIMDPQTQSLLRMLPAVGELLARPEVAGLIARWGHDSIAQIVREVVAAVRERIGVGSAAGVTGADLSNQIVDEIQSRAASLDHARLGAVVNATGVVLHTSLGRAALCHAAEQALCEVAAGCNLEVDLDSGTRRPRGYQLQQAWRQLTGAEAVLVVNNNAAATVLALSALASGREVILSRGQLVEIGGSFRLPEIFAASGARLQEVGTTNRTHLTDYERAISPQTAGILRVHPSNYRIEGFVESPGIESLVRLAQKFGVWAIDDIGSGCLVDTSRYGLPREPTFRDSVLAGADLVLGSGDKLLGGPQCGILVGKQELIDQLRRHPLARAFRVDKLTLAALQATLEVYLRGSADRELPLLAMLSAPAIQLRARAVEILRQLSTQTVLSPDESSAVFATCSVGPLLAEVGGGQSLIGGGSLATATLPTAVIRLTHVQWSAEEVARRLRVGTPRVFPRIDRDRVVVDLRSMRPEEDSAVTRALCRLAQLV